MKKVSLILTTFNCKDNLLKTLESIEKQDYPNIEIIIKDGASTDGTLEVIKSYQKNSHNDVKYISQKDNGIYDAMNQGYRLSTGELVAIFNECYIPEDAISKMVKVYEKSEESCVGVHTDLVYVNGDRVIREWHMGSGKIENGWMPGHPTLLLKKEIYEKYGLYDTSFKISADYEFMIRFLKDEENKLAYIPEKMIAMFYGGTSTGGLKNYLLSFKESYRALKINGVNRPLLITIRRTIKVLGQFLSRENAYENNKVLF